MILCETPFRMSSLIAYAGHKDLHQIVRFIKIYHLSLVWVEDRKIRPEDHCLASLGLPVTFMIDSITKTYRYNSYPLKPNFYIEKLGFTRMYIIFLISAQNIDCGDSLEPPLRGGSNEYPQSMFRAEIWKISESFIWKLPVFGGDIFNIFE